MWKITLKICLGRRHGLFVVFFMIISCMFLLENPVQIISDQYATDVLNDLCVDYHSSKLTGNLCADICDKNTLVFTSCLRCLHPEGKQVYKTVWKGETVILKSRKHHFPPASTSLDQLAEVVTQQVLSVIPSVKSNNLLERMWFENQNQEFDSNGFWSEAAVQSLHTLLQQPEYVLHKYHSDSKVLSNILGSCGHFYAMENNPPQGINVPALFQPERNNQPWRTRARLALKMISLVKKLDSFPSKPLYFCDLKELNMGVSASGELKAIDTDSMVFQSKIGDIMSNQKCSSYLDCSFVWCRGWCNSQTGRCENFFINNNMQLLCKNVFYPDTAKYHTSRGLLYDPPSLEVAKAITICVDPPPPQDASLLTPGCLFQNNKQTCSKKYSRCPEYSATDVIRERLKTLLEQSIDQG